MLDKYKDAKMRRILEAMERMYAAYDSGNYDEAISLGNSLSTPHSFVSTLATKIEHVAGVGLSIPRDYPLEIHLRHVTILGMSQQALRRFQEARANLLASLAILVELKASNKALALLFLLVEHTCSDEYDDVATPPDRRVALSKLGVETLTKAIALVPSEHLFRFRRGLLYARTGQYDLALEDARYILRKSPDNEQGTTLETLVTSARSSGIRGETSPSTGQAVPSRFCRACGASMPNIKISCAVCGYPIDILRVAPEKILDMWASLLTIPGIWDLDKYKDPLTRRIADQLRLIYEEYRSAKYKRAAKLALTMVIPSDNPRIPWELLIRHTMIIGMFQFSTGHYAAAKHSFLTCVATLEDQDAPNAAIAYALLQANESVLEEYAEKPGRDHVLLKQGIEYLTKAIRLMPREPEWLFRRATVYGELAQWHLALDDARAGLNLDPTDEEGRTILNLALQQM